MLFKSWFDIFSWSNISFIIYCINDSINTCITGWCYDGFHIFFPDPWPKKKHHKRRLIQKDFVNLLSRKLKKGGYIYLVTDWEEYAEWMLDILSQESLIENAYDSYAEPRSWRPRTKFEQKGLDKDYKINELWFVKKWIRDLPYGGSCFILEHYWQWVFILISFWYHNNSEEIW